MKKTYSRRQFGLSKKKQKIIISASVATIVAALGAAAYKDIGSIIDVNAAENENQTLENAVYGNEILRDFSPIIPKNISDFVDDSSGMGGPVSASSLPSSYDSRSLGRISRQEDQAGEGICWAYGMTTTAESYLLSKGLVSSAVEFSPKHLDYITAPASSALSDSSTNKYEDYAYGVVGSHREIAGGNNLVTPLSAMSGKYSLVEDNDFFAKMKLNDPSTLGSYSSYSSFILAKYPATYTTKQKTADIFSQESAKYAVTSAEYLLLDGYSGGEMDQERTDTIARIKEHIQDYGAVSIGSHYSEDKCMYKEGQNYTIIDRTTDTSQDACDVSASKSTGHGMVLVGWNDDWAYKDNSVNRTGAFIVQNSYGNTGVNYYLSYNSYAVILAITDMKDTSSIENVFDAENYVKTVNKNDYEVVFDFASADKYNINQITVINQAITGNALLGWDVYAKSGNGEYVSIDNFNDDYTGMMNLDGLDIATSGNFSIKIKYNAHGYTVTGLTPEVFAQYVAPVMSVAVYAADSEEPTPEPTPTPVTPVDPSEETDEEESTKIPVPNTGAAQENKTITSSPVVIIAIISSASIAVIARNIFKRKKISFK